MNVLLNLGFGEACSKLGVPSKASFQRAFEIAFGAGLRALKRRNVAEIALSVQIVGAEQGLALNQSYRQKPYATNVLAFPTDSMTQKQGWFGDVVICKLVIEQEARAQNKLLKHHYLHMTVHAGLHLLGFDHLNDAEASAMEALETKVLADLGIADPYLEAS
jgi:probable rRNA maturation factor